MADLISSDTCCRLACSWTSASLVPINSSMAHKAVNQTDIP
jgi:hypothetical protein